MQAEYFKLLGGAGLELAILRDVLLGEIAAVGGTWLAEGIGRMCRGEVIAQAGYDGEYGVIRVFGGLSGTGVRCADGIVCRVKREIGRGERGKARIAFFHLADPCRPRLFGFNPVPVLEAVAATTLIDDDTSAYGAPPITHHPCGSRITSDLNDQQRAAVLCTDAPLVIVAG